ncbi:hypothetical protein AB1N83_011719 [Pleurotus pulmonarius]
MANNPVLIAVMGMVGSGKTSVGQVTSTLLSQLITCVHQFVNLASASALKVGDNLRSCTTDTQVSKSFQLDGRQISLIDTPGFDDTTKSDFDVLNVIAAFLTQSYKQVSPTVGDAREAELASDALFFKPVLDKGAQLLRHDNTDDSAKNILRHIIKNHPLPLLVQTDLVDRGLDLSGTSAANILDCEVNKQKEKHRDELRRVREAKDEALRAKIQEKPNVVAQGTSQLRADLARLRADLANKQSTFSASNAALQQQACDQSSASQIATNQLISGYEARFQVLTQHLQSVRSQQESEKAVLINRINQLRS